MEHNNWKSIIISMVTKTSWMTTTDIRRAIPEIHHNYLKNLLGVLVKEGILVVRKDDFYPVVRYALKEKQDEAMALMQKRVETSKLPWVKFPADIGTCELAIVEAESIFDDCSPETEIFWTSLVEHLKVLLTRFDEK